MNDQIDIDHSKSEVVGITESRLNHGVVTLECPECLVEFSRMPSKFEPKSVDLVITTAESLKKAAEQLTEVAAEMQRGGLKDACFPWTQRQWDCIDVVITLANQCVAVLPAQILAKNKAQAATSVTKKKK